jgi:hypothetical protein
MFITLPVVGLEIVGVIVLVAIVLGTFVSTIGLLFLVINMATVAVAFSNFASFVFDF